MAIWAPLSLCQFNPYVGLPPTLLGLRRASENRGGGSKLSRRKRVLVFHKSKDVGAVFLPLFRDHRPHLEKGLKGGGKLRCGEYPNFRCLCRRCVWLHL